MASVEPQILAVGRDTLGESPVWDSEAQAVFWVDQLARKIRRFVPCHSQLTEWVTPKIVGAVALAGPDRLIVALADGFYSLHLPTGDWRLLAAVEQARPQIRLNDGRCDRAGRFICGGVVPDGQGPDACLYRLHGDGRVEVLRRNLTIGNGVCFNVAGDIMYFTDSRTGVMMACDYDPAGTAVGEPRLFADTRPYGSVPDGATVDAEGGVWIALIQNGTVVRFRADGTFDRQIDLPVPYVTSVCFGGAALDTLYVTSLRDTGMRFKTDHANAGALFAIRLAGVAGVAEPHFKGLDSRGTAVGASVRVS